MILEKNAEGQTALLNLNFSSSVSFGVFPYFPLLSTGNQNLKISDPQGAEKSFLKEKCGTTDTEFAGAAFAQAKDVTANEFVGLRAQRGRLGNNRSLPPTTPNTDTCIERAVRETITAKKPIKSQMWKWFHAVKQRGYHMYMYLKEHDQQHSHFEALQHASFRCRTGAAQRKGRDGQTVSIGTVSDGSLAWLGTYKCGSARFCPLCASAIAMKNEAEVRKGVENAIEKGGSFIFVTRTIPHQKSETLLSLVDKFTQAMKISSKGGTLSRTQKKLGVLGSISRQEETYGVNGWHPHIHELIIFDRILSNAEAQKYIELLKKKWSQACYAVSAVPENRTKAFDEHGFTAEYTQLPEKLDHYISKFGWDAFDEESKKDAKREIKVTSQNLRRGIEYELTAKSTKSPTSAEGRSVWSIYEGFANGSQRDTFLWLEYVQAFKGKATLRWSPLLKQKLGLKDESNEDIVYADDDQEIEHIYEIKVEQYNKAVVKNGLWLPILEMLEEKRFDYLQYIADKYEIDFLHPKKANGSKKHVVGYPEIRSRKSKIETEAEAERKATQRVWRKFKLEQKRLVEERDAKVKAQKQQQQTYSMSLLEQL